MVAVMRKRQKIKVQLYRLREDRWRAAMVARFAGRSRQ